MSGEAGRAVGQGEGFPLLGHPDDLHEVIGREVPADILRFAPLWDDWVLVARKERPAERVVTTEDGRIVRLALPDQQQDIPEGWIIAAGPEALPKANYTRAELIGLPVIFSKFAGTALKESETGSDFWTLYVVVHIGDVWGVTGDGRGPEKMRVLAATPWGYVPVEPT